MTAIGRHRKLIYNKFMNLEQRKVKIDFNAAKEVIKEMLDHCKIKMDDRNWPLLIKFAAKDGIIDLYQSSTTCIITSILES